MAPRQLLRLALAQQGAVSRRQLLTDVGVSASTISRWCVDGRVMRIGPGLFRVASHADSFGHRCWAATLFGDGIGFVSGTSAGRLHGLRRMNPTIVEFTVPERCRKVAPSWMHVRYTNWYSPSQHRSVVDGGIVVATPLRMLFGLAARMNQHRFDAAADDAWNLGLITPESTARFLGQCRASGKNGVRRIETWLERVADQRSAAQSYLERDLIDALEAVGLPAPQRQHALQIRTGEWIHLDAAWPLLRLAVEPGHSYFHGLAGGQERDHRRDAACAAAGWQVVRLNELMLASLPEAARLVADVYRRRERDLAA